MPGLTLKLSGQPDPALARRIVPALTALTCDVLEKQPAQTMVMLQFVPHELWFIENRSLAEHGRNSFRLEVTVTDETNTKAQKARYQKAAFDLLSEMIGNLHPHSNVHIIDCRASAYGYGGVTQEYRFQHANPSPRS
ncbi:4-oxalocrotonate tautomerase [Siccirubricoccus sp. KC 17139]|uniref:4-oxalocrotonate tautomerase n=1 Tax=Siccirubricoccus soli TaxID=2899147 RepID=A0ABT1DA18_9PROT|nr:4-oxalocrotonate tautomerase [Siccirubricoccus soli]MCO6418034.1 4-oxalocrotonate tautomerase [Siccirubricoccus soli]MCP2684169.1 4-oxalocrotonate tautomerase [Siccirubricoccus soli]